MRVPLTIRDFLRRAVEVFPERVAVIDEPGVVGSLGTLTYGEFDARVRGLASALAARGITVGDRVGIVSPNAAKFLIAYWGVSGFGRVLVPINYRLSRDEVAYIVEHSGTSLLLVDPEFAPTFAGVGGVETIVLDGVDDAELFAAAPNDEPGPAWEPDEDATASINYTSGTTSRPKGVELTHRNCWVNATVFGWHLGVNDRDVLMHTLPMFHANGWGMPYAATGMGATHVVVRKIDGEEILRRVADHRVTLACGAPAVWAAVLDAAASRRDRGETVPGRDQVRIVVAGAPPPSRTVERIETELGWQFNQIYGLTETSPVLTVNRRPKEWDDLPTNEVAKRLAKAGTPAIGVELRTDADGEVLARSNVVFKGYWRQPEETAAALEGGWFHTGDGGVMAGGYLTIMDRKKDVIISGGENVSSIEVEDVLFQHPAVAEVAVIGVPDAKWGETVKALVVVRDGATVSGEELREFCRERLAHYKCPSTVEFRSELPRTATGKLQKYKLRQPYWEGYERQVN